MRFKLSGLVANLGGSQQMAHFVHARVWSVTQEDDRAVGSGLPDALHDLEAVAVRQADVQQHHLGAEAEEELHRRLASVRLGAEAQSRFLVEHRAQMRPHGKGIVHHQH